ncbi:hypothetical protein LRAMOSA07024 [Lichtheimia ramosa]|uniref:Cyclin n=1 Tax=Lichtheimia ramosa TaxID=688394 RepID=A0A077WBV2_9FUNG|nr:hypothetical protein LRAMOSA07024 [Lichtheimia ramosa]
MSLPPFRFDIARHPTKDTIRMLASLLEKVASANDRLHPAPAVNGDPPRHGRSRSLSHASPYTCFHARSIPSISIHAYLSRILKYCPCANECFLAILVYFDRLSKASRQPLRIDSYNIHRLVISAIMVSSKLLSDVFFTNTRYAKVGGLPVSELNVLEVQFIVLNDYALFVSVDELQNYGDQLLLHWMKEQEGYPEGRVPPRMSAVHDALSSTKENEPQQEDQDEYSRVHKVARHLSIDKGDSRRCSKEEQQLPTPPDSSAPHHPSSSSSSSSS